MVCKRDINIILKTYIVFKHILNMATQVQLNQIVLLMEVLFIYLFFQKPSIKIKKKHIDMW